MCLNLRCFCISFFFWFKLLSLSLSLRLSLFPSLYSLQPLSICPSVFIFIYYLSVNPPLILSVCLSVLIHTHSHTHTQHTSVCIYVYICVYIYIYLSNHLLSAYTKILYLSIRLPVSPSLSFSLTLCIAICSYRQIDRNIFLYFLPFSLSLIYTYACLPLYFSLTSWVRK
jgi:hypothetical protein